MITITACARKSQTSALRLAASPASRVVLYEFGLIDIVCTRASIIGTSKSTDTHTDNAILHTLYTVFPNWRNIFIPKQIPMVVFTVKQIHTVPR